MLKFEVRRRVEPLRATSMRAGLRRPPGLSAACGGGVCRRLSTLPPVAGIIAIAIAIAITDADVINP